jgi:hypothetical protein
MTKFNFFDKNNIQNIFVNEESSAIRLPIDFLQKMDTDLSIDFINNNIAAINKGGFSLRLSTIKYDNKRCCFIITGMLDHTNFVYCSVEIIAKYLSNLTKNQELEVFKKPTNADLWAFSWGFIDLKKILKKYYLKPLKPPFDIKNIEFDIEYWTTDYPNSTFLRIDFRDKTSKNELEEFTQNYLNSIKFWDGFMPHFSHLKGVSKGVHRFQIDDEASFKIKTLNEKTLLIHIIFNEFESLWTAEWYLRWLSYSFNSKINKVTFEWTF